MYQVQGGLSTKKLKKIKKYCRGFDRRGGFFEKGMAFGRAKLVASGASVVFFPCMVVLSAVQRFSFFDFPDEPRRVAPSSFRDPVLGMLSSEIAQALVVAKGPSSISATVSAWERKEQGWFGVRGTFRAAIGRNGFAPRGKKREGDGRTPSGIFPLESAFGYAAKAPTAMPYRRIGKDDVWVDDPASPDYNQWTKRRATEALSFEELRRADGLYEIGVVVGYNRRPAKSGLGSAIFFHVWAGEGIPTSGCVATSREDLLTILSWLDPLKNPVAILGSTASQE
jgi:L,D-peptidoglycan transpeptidase YkuD (ErfK/YbiS/YcfS/YnhG family)